MHLTLGSRRVFQAFSTPQPFPFGRRSAVPAPAQVMHAVRRFHRESTMKNTYKLTRTWNYMMIGSCIGFLLIIVMVIASGSASVKDDGFIWIVLIWLGMIALSYGTLSSKIITSAEKFECVSFGIRVQATWDKVERVDINPYGFVNLFFKEPLYKNQFFNALLRPLAYDRTIQLSPYIEDMATSNLLKDIAKYVPNANIPEFVVENTSSTKNFQKVGTIGLYYFGFFILMVLLAFVFRKGAEYLEASGFQNATLVSYIMSTSLIIGLFVNGMSLLGYNAEISKLQDHEISHKARTHYLSPIIALLLGFAGGIIIWAILQSRSIIIKREEDFVLVAMLLGIVSLRASSAIERLIFKDDIL